MRTDYPGYCDPSNLRSLRGGDRLWGKDLEPVRSESPTESPLLPGGEIVGKLDPDFNVEIIQDRSFDSIHKLAAGRVAGLQFKNVASIDWCQEVATRFIEHPETHRESVIPAIFTLGKHLYACGSGETIQCYFNEMEDTNRVMKTIFPNQEDLLISFLKELATSNGLGFEFLEAEGKSVQHGTLRLWGRKESADKQSDATSESENSLRFFANPHEDLKETNSDHPMLQQIQGCDNIYGVILCISAVPGHEPRTVLWDKELNLSEIRDPKNKISGGSYGFTTALLEDSKVCAIKLLPGDLGIIPAHKVHAVVGYDNAERCTLSGFIHFIKDSDGRPTKIVYRT